MYLLHLASEKISFITLTLFIAVVVLLSIVLYQFRVVESNIALVATAIIWVSLIPSAIYIIFSNNASFPFFQSVGLFYTVFFGIPVFTIPLAWPDGKFIHLYANQFLAEINIDVLWLVLAGIALMVLFFYGARHMLFRHIPFFRFPANIEFHRITTLFWLLMWAHLAYQAIPLMKVLPSIGQFLEPIGYIAFGGLYFAWRRGHLSKFQKILLCIVCLPLEVYFKIETLFITELIFLLLFFIYILWRERDYRSLISLSILVVVVISTYGATTTIRAGAPPGMGRLLLAGKAYFSQMIQNDKSMPANEQGDQHIFNGRFGSLASRTGQLWIFHYVYNKSPQEISYWNGYTYRLLLTSFIPRIVYPDKPKETIGSEFGIRYELLNPSDKHISINLPWITELLANFGPFGVLFGMAVIGFFLSFLDRIFNNSNQSDLEFLVSTTLIFKLVYPESNFSVIIGSFIPFLILIYLYFILGARMIGNKNQNHLGSV